MAFPVEPNGKTACPMALGRDAMGRGAAPSSGDWQAVSFLTHSRTVRKDCAGGRVTLEVHPGRDFIPHGGIARQLDRRAGCLPTSP